MRSVSEHLTYSYRTCNINDLAEQWMPLGLSVNVEGDGSFQAQRLLVVLSVPTLS